MGFDPTILAKDMGTAAAMIIVTLMFLTHLQKVQKEHQANIKELIVDFTARVKDILELSGAGHQEIKESYEKMMALVSDSHAVNTKSLSDAAAKAAGAAAGAAKAAASAAAAAARAVKR